MRQSDGLMAKVLCLCRGFAKATTEQAWLNSVMPHCDNINRGGIYRSNVKKQLLDVFQLCFPAISC